MILNCFKQGASTHAPAGSCYTVLVAKANIIVNSSQGWCHQYSTHHAVGVTAWYLLFSSLLYLPYLYQYVTVQVLSILSLLLKWKLTSTLLSYRSLRYVGVFVKYVAMNMANHFSVRLLHVTNIQLTYIKC